MTDHHHSHGHSHPVHTASEQSDRPQYDDVNTGIILMVGLISAIVTFVIIGFVQGLAYRWEAYFEQQRTQVVNEKVKAEVEAQRAILSSTNGADGQPVAGRMTIEDAKKAVLEKFKQASEGNKTSSSSESSNPGSQVASGQ